MIDVAHDGDDRRTGYEVIIDVLVSQEPGFDIAFRNPPNGVTELSGYQFGGIGIDHVARFEHHAFARQEFDDLDGACGHPTGQILHGYDVGNDDFAGRLSGFGAAPLALFAFPFPRTSDRG